MKALLKRLLLNPPLAKTVTRLLLKVHSMSYKYLGIFAAAAEDGLHPKHRLMDYHKFFLENISEGDVVLDIGCGNGVLTYDLAKKAKHVYAIDINRMEIEFAKDHYQSNNITYLVADATKYQSTHQFDVIILSNVLEHIENRPEFLQKIAPLAKFFLIRVPMINRDWITLYKKELGIEWKLDSSHHIEYTHSQLAEEMNNAGLSIQFGSVQFGEMWVKVVKNKC